MDEENKTTREKLAGQIGTAPWSLLEVHAQSDHLILADASLSILDVATAVADNESETVNTWIEESLLAKPSLEQWTRFKNEDGLRFQFVIVHPFVIGQVVNINL